MNKIIEKNEVLIKKKYDVIVAGGGVAGIAAALTARREGKSVLLLEKSTMLGGLATLGLINYFVPMCNGRGKRIIYGMVDEFIELAIKYGWEVIPPEWKSGEPEKPTNVRYSVRYSPNIFALTLTEQVIKEGIDLYIDTLASTPVMNGSHCKGIIVENKSGRQFFEGSIIIDATGDADILYRAGVPTIQGRNYFTYIAKAIDINHCRKAVESNRIEQAIYSVSGGTANLFGKNHPEGMEYYTGTTAESVNNFIIRNQLELIRKLRNDAKETREIVTLPGMAQFRTTRCIEGDYILKETDTYKHFEDSVCVINDFEHPDYLFEIPYRTMVRKGFNNLITAGRSVSGKGYAWDCLRVIPPAILTGQVAGLAAVQAIDTKSAITEINITVLQEKLKKQEVMIHFDDSLIPDNAKPGERIHIPADTPTHDEI